jgi:hypothetical protein
MAYSRARSSWADYPDLSTLVRAQDIEKWDAALYALKNLTANVKDNGAVGDGVANDGSAVNSTLTAAGTAFTVFPTATYLVSALTSLLFSKIDGLGSTLKPSANSISVLTLKSGSTLQSGDFLSVKNLLIDATGKTDITGITTDGGAGGSVASGVLENIYAANCDTVSFNLGNSQFLRSYNLRAVLGNGVGFIITNDASSGGGNSHDYYGLHAIQKEVGVFVNGTRFDTGCHSLNFYNPQILSNSVCGMAFFDANATIYGGAPETNAAGAATKTVDSQTVRRCSLQANNSIIRVDNFQVAEATADPCFIAENKAILTLKDLSGYGLGSGVLVQTDASSSIHLEGVFAAAGTVQGVSSWPTGWILPDSAQSIMYGEPVSHVDPTLPVLFAHPAPAIAGQGANAPTMSYVEDADLGYCRQAVYQAFAGGASGNTAIMAVGSGVASKATIISILVKSSIDTQIGINTHNGSSYNDINTQQVFLKAGKVTRLIYGKRNIPANGAWNLYWYPVGTDAPTIQFANLQVYQGTPDLQTTDQEIAKIISTGAFQPGPSRATAANLAIKANIINTAGKYPGKQAWDTTNNRVVFAAGRLDTDVWKDGVNATVYTPV